MQDPTEQNTASSKPSATQLATHENYSGRVAFNLALAFGPPVLVGLLRSGALGEYTTIVDVRIESLIGFLLIPETATESGICRSTAKAQLFVSTT